MRTSRTIWTGRVHRADIIRIKKLLDYY